MVPGPLPVAARLIVVADRLIDGTGAAPIERPAIRVADGRIVGIESHGAGWTPDAGWAVIDGTGTTAVPGFIDAHVHLAFPDPGAPMPLDVLERAAELRAADTLVGGVTTVRDLGSAYGIAVRLRDAVAAGRVAGPRIVAAGAPVTTRGGHCHWFGELADTADELLVAVDRLAAAGVDWIKVMATGGMATPGSDPYVAQYGVEELRIAVDRAHRHGLRVAAHALCTAGVRTAVAAGVDTLEHGWTITGRAQDYEPRVAHEVAASDVFGSVTAHDALRNLLPGPTLAGGDVVEIRRRLVPHRGLAAAGVPMVVHSDAGPGPTRFDDFAASIRAYAAGMDASNVAAIRAATGTAAAALGLSSDLGTIEPGRVADLLLIDGDAADALPTRERVRRVILGGRTVAIDGHLIS